MSIIYLRRGALMDPLTDTAGDVFGVDTLLIAESRTARLHGTAATTVGLPQLTNVLRRQSIKHRLVRPGGARGRVLTSQ